MIILEGPDNSGKSTLGALISREFNIPCIHSTRPTSPTPVAVLRHSREQLTPKRVVLDRVFVISEPIYGPICRGYDSLSECKMEAMMDLYYRPYLIIYCRPDSQTILRNQGRDQMEGVLENHQKIIDSYDQYMEDLSRFSHCTVVQYDWKNYASRDSVMKAVINHLINFDSCRQSAAFSPVIK